eukprot:TRINITY_DN50775_c0_g1_i1.p1 TRINITY_DN50775_c0_g1~~TRINITY_DN50775_c0_g1_i1.p1  ORF type:complete len:153 (-),score=30.87 TRINITY_DN50775_c0_g1_i1:355-813(-)
MQLSLTVNKLDGTSVQISVKETDTIAIVKTAIKEKTGTPTEQQQLCLGTDILDNDEAKLGESGITEDTPLQLVLVNRYALKLISVSGPNTPRFGIDTSYKWEMKCSCGYSEVWEDRRGYDFESHNVLSEKACPGCGGKCGDPVASFRTRFYN